MTTRHTIETEDPEPFHFYLLDDEDDEHWRQLSAAEGYTALGMFAEAHRELDLADQHEDFRLEVAVRKLDLLLAEKRWKEACIYGELLTEFDEEQPAHFMNYATALHALGRTSTAIYVLSLAPTVSERDPAYQLRLAAYQLETGEPEEALFHLKNAIALRPDLRESTARDPRLGGLVPKVPRKPRFIPSHPDDDLGQDADFWDGSARPAFDDDPDFNCPF